MATRTTVRLPENLYDSMVSYVKENNVKSINDLFIMAVESFLSGDPQTSQIIYQENNEHYQTMTQLLDEYKKQLDLLNNQLKEKDNQLKTKDQQIFSLIAVQKDLTEKTTEQVKLLSERIGSKKWYQFWK